MPSVCISVISVRAFVIKYILQKVTYLRNDAALCEELPVLAAALRFVSSYAVKFVQTSFAEKLQLMGHIFVANI